jgi:hypothetical protein
MSRVLKMPLDWHYPRTNTGTFAMFDHDGESYTFRVVPGGIDIYRAIDGDECRLAQTDTVTEAREFVNLYSAQLIDC